jgi:hypothetical protein
MVLAVALGVALAIDAPLVAGYFEPIPPAWPTPGLVAPSIVLMFCLLTALRVAVSLPAELRAAWLFAAAAGRGWRWHRRAMRRMFWLFGVFPALAILVPTAWHLQGAVVSLRAATLLVALGALFVETLLSDADGMPCTQPFSPRTTLMRSRWPWYVMILLTAVLPALEAELLRRPVGWAVLACILLVGARLMRVRAERSLPPPGLTFEAFEEASRFDLH